jgi:hypothetical protein
MKERLESKAQIYAVYWKCENLLAMVWKIVNENLAKHTDFTIDLFMRELETSVKASSYYQATDDEGSDEFRYLPREVYVESVMDVFFNLFYPSMLNILEWKQTVQQTFQQLYNLVSLYLRNLKTTK